MIVVSESSWWYDRNCIITCACRKHVHPTVSSVCVFCVDVENLQNIFGKRRKIVFARWTNGWIYALLLCHVPNITNDAETPVETFDEKAWLVWFFFSFWRGRNQTPSYLGLRMECLHHTWIKCLLEWRGEQHLVPPLWRRLCLPPPSAWTAGWRHPAADDDQKKWT